MKMWTCKCGTEWVCTSFKCEQLMEGSGCSAANCECLECNPKLGYSYHTYGVNLVPMLDLPGKSTVNIDGYCKVSVY